MRAYTYTSRHGKNMAKQGNNGQPRMLLINGVQTDVSSWPDVAIDAVVREQERATKAETDAAARASRAIGYSVGPSGTLVMTGISSRGLALYGGQWAKVVEQVTSGALQAALLANEPHLATRDAAGRPVAPRQPKANYGNPSAGSTPATEAPKSLADRAAAAAAETMAARDAAEQAAH